MKTTIYNKEFVKKILQGDKDIKAEKGKKITLDELENLGKKCFYIYSHPTHK